QLLRVHKGSLRVEFWIIRDRCVVYYKSRRKHAQTYFTETDAASQPVRKIRLDCASVAVNVKCSRKNRNTHNQDHENDSDRNAKLAHNGDLPAHQLSLGIDLQTQGARCALWTNRGWLVKLCTSSSVWHDSSHRHKSNAPCLCDWSTAPVY